jgi:hypothetical protein
MKNQFKFTNNTGKKFSFSLEPEGEILSLNPKESLEIELTGNSSPVIDVQLQEDNNGVYIAIWPENGAYKVK